DLYLGKNLYDDFTLQNHSYFHTSYQNVVMQELGESLLAMKLFQDSVYGRENWKTNSLMHNNQKVMDNVLNYLALADGELAMPNGNDWSLFLYDQITSYATMACFARDPNALMLENLAYQNIKARQATTTDGSWLLRPDVGARRMGVEAHRVMMTWLMHEAASTATMAPTAWNDFRKKHESAVLWTTQNIVRAATPERFSCFSWSSGLSSYTGYFTQNLPDKNKIIVPYKANNTGNIVGWYIVNGQTINASPVTSGIYTLKGNSYTMNGILNTNGNTLTNNFALYSTPGNALIYLDYVKANGSLSITGERGGLLAVSTDDFTKQKRDLYYEGGYLQTNGSTMSTFTSSWINIDNQIGVLTPGSTSMGFGDRAVNNSIYTAKLYPLYNATTRSVNSGDLVGRRQVVYYSNVTAEQTKTMTAQTVSLKDLLPSGWNGIIVTDPDSIRFALVSNFAGTTNAEVSGLAFAEGAPVFSSRTMVKDGQSTVHFTLNTAHSQGDVLRVFITSGNITACQATDSISVYLTNTQVTATSVGLTILTSSTAVKGTVSVPAASRILVRVINGTLVTSFAPEEAAPDNDITSLILKNAGFDEAPITYNVSGTLNNNAVNKWNDAGYSSAYSYNVTGWNNASIVNDNASFTATFALGSIAKFNGTTPPATDVSGKSSGNVLGVSSGWGTGNAVQFYQEVKLPAGKYLLKYDVYNANTSSTSIIRNLCGFFSPDATAKETIINVFDGNLNFPSSTWTTDSVTLGSAEPLDVLISIGASCSSASSNAGAKLFLDNVRLLTDQTTETVQNYLNNLTGIISPVADKNADEKVSV
ncbi:MAG: hypothetical protein Q8914_13390, partial [Bacteroidota bacterium]|nr:hypothetical protein [Bacteroidota bacterium]